MINTNLLKQGIEDLGLVALNDQLNLMDKYAEALVEKNKVMNLTRITEPNKILTDHFLDSLTTLLAYTPKEGDIFLDIGTGAGFPGVPLAIMNPNTKVVMLDSTAKKINFVKETCESLSVNNVTFLTGRGEVLAHNMEYREKFDCVCARAVSDMKILSEIALPYVKLGGVFIALKSINIKDEIQRAQNTIKNLGGVISEIKTVCVPISNTQISLIIIKKISKTKKKFPRNYGEIIK